MPASWRRPAASATGVGSSPNRSGRRSVASGGSAANASLPIVAKSSSLERDDVVHERRAAGGVALGVREVAREDVAPLRRTQVGDALIEVGARVADVGHTTELEGLVVREVRGLGDERVAVVDEAPDGAPRAGATWCQVRSCCPTIHEIGRWTNLGRGSPSSTSRSPTRRSGLPNAVSLKMSNVVSHEYRIRRRVADGLLEQRLRLGVHELRRAIDLAEAHRDGNRELVRARIERHALAAARGVGERELESAERAVEEAHVVALATLVRHVARIDEQDEPARAGHLAQDVGRDVAVVHFARDVPEVEAGLVARLGVEQPRYGTGGGRQGVETKVEATFGERLVLTSGQCWEPGTGNGGTALAMEACGSQFPVPGSRLVPAMPSGS